MTRETTEVLAWLSRFISTLEDGALDGPEAVEVLTALAGVADRLRASLGRRWWRWLCGAVSHCLREGAEEIRRREEAAHAPE